MSHERRLRRVFAGGAAALIALTGVGLSSAPALADDGEAEGATATSVPETFASGDRLQGRFVIVNSSRLSHAVKPAPDGMAPISSSRTLSGKPLVGHAGEYSFPGLGNTGEIRAFDGRCMTQTEPMTMMACNGMDLQQFTLRADGQLVAASTGYGIVGRQRNSTDGNPPMYANYEVMGGSQLRTDLLSPSTPDYPAFSARLQSSDAVARSAVLVGTGKPGTEVSLNGGPRVVVGPYGWSATVTNLNLGQNSVRVDVFEGGRWLESATVQVNLQLNALSAQVDFSNDLAQNATISGYAHPGAAVEIWQGNTRVTTVNANGSNGYFSASIAAPNAGGVKTYTVKQVVGGTAAPGSVDVHADYGSAVTISAPINGQVHNGGALRFQGYGVPGGNVVLSQRGVAGQLGSTTVASNGLWTIDVANVAKRNLSFDVTQTGRGANVTTAAVEINPGVKDEELTVLTPAEGAKLKEGTVTFTGTANAGASIELRSNQTGALLGSTTARADGTWSASVNRALTAGNYTILVKNAGLEVARSFVIEAPAVQERLTVATPAAGAKLNPGTVTFTGTANPGAKVELRSNVSGALLGSTTSKADGSWVTDVNRQLGAGEYTIVVKNGSLSIPRSFTVGTPAAQERLEVTAPAAGERLRPGIVTFVGTANPGARVELVSNVSGGLLGSTTAKADGTWVTDVNRPLGKGDYVIVVKNGSLKVTRAFSIGDQLVGAPLMVTSPSPSAVLEPGTVEFMGTSEPGASIEVRSKTTNALLGTGTANGSGNWTVTLNRKLGVDNYFLQVKSGSQTVDREFSVAEKSVPGERLDVVTPAAGSTIRSGQVTFTGTANPGAKVQLRSNVSGIVLGEGTTNQAGNWSAVTTNALGEGAYTVVVTNGKLRVERTFRISDTPVVGRLEVTSPAQNAVVNPGPITFTGIAEPGARVVLRSNVSGLTLVEGTAAGSGNWSVTTNVQLGVATYTILVESSGNQVARAFQVR